ncbi:MAG: spore cortex-lytic enzyme [Candidatus Cohnella colombiensis]|uniref:Spore cortex-lytic enzyme n=1 Tax=Candidatus Cohnella colombiensis TaxID=3121368 RepID=A0AA95F022_9BACL|nr:MAG: spore cortex-lytic enzyme [Cohnella sp.]
MKYRLLIWTVCLVFGLLGLNQLQHHEQSRETFGTTILKQGTTGKDIYELQGRLKALGYFNGNVDGIFGPKTKNAVTWFQWKFGLKSDGIVGAKTKLMLWKATKDWKPTAAELPGGTTANKETSTSKDNNLPASNDLGFTQKDLQMMANAVYGESRGEPYIGQVAVAAVIINRVKSSEFPNTATGVIFQPGAFTAVADGQIWLTPNESAMKAVKDAVSGLDPSDGCLYYFNPETATSKWIWTRPQYKTIGKHIFCR